jgi:hypothetical protein
MITRQTNVDQLQQECPFHFNTWIFSIAFLSGLMNDISKSYLITYIAAGSAIFLSGAILLMARFLLPRNRMNWK